MTRYVLVLCLPLFCFALVLLISPEPPPGRPASLHVPMANMGAVFTRY